MCKENPCGYPIVNRDDLVECPRNKNKKLMAKMSKEIPYAAEVAGHKIHKVDQNDERIFVDYRGQFEQ